MNMKEADRPIDFQPAREKVPDSAIQINPVLTDEIINEHYPLF